LHVVQIGELIALQTVVQSGLDVVQLIVCCVLHVRIQFDQFTFHQEVLVVQSFFQILSQVLGVDLDIIRVALDVCGHRAHQLSCLSGVVVDVGDGVCCDPVLNLGLLVAHLSQDLRVQSVYDAVGLGRAVVVAYVHVVFNRRLLGASQLVYTRVECRCGCRS